MQIEECASVAKQAGGIAVCAVQHDSILSTIASGASIIASAAIVATAIFAFFQLKGLKTQLDAGRESHRLTATHSLLTRMQTDPHWRDNRSKFIDLRSDKTGLKRHIHERTADATAIRSQLNQYELIAVGIKAGIIDEKMLKDYYRTTIIRDWNACYEFISEERRDSPTYWTELEALVARLRQ